MLMRLIIAQVVLLIVSTQAWGVQITKKVNCGKGETISHALQGFDRIPITIQVKGTCYENVEIDRDDVTLIGDPSDPSRVTVNGAADPNRATITVSGARTVIDGLTVTGGRNGIGVAGDSTIRNCTVQNNHRSGIIFWPPSRGGTVDSCTVQNNELAGIVIDTNGPSVIKSTITSNGGSGIVVDQGGRALIGITARFFEYAGNTISNNQAAGIFVISGGSAHIGDNTISGNATFGILINLGANGNLWGKNTITGNEGTGVFASVGSVVQIGGSERGDQLPATNVISGNGATTSGGGIYAANGASLSIRFATIDHNKGNGITLSNRSTATLSDSIINNNNPGNGILLSQGASLVLQDPAVAVTGNTLFGLQCEGTESSYAGNPIGISGNTAGDVSGNCTGFND